MLQDLVYLSFLKILHQIQLLLEVAAFIPIARSRNCWKQYKVHVHYIIVQWDLDYLILPGGLNYSETNPMAMTFCLS